MPAILHGRKAGRSGLAMELGIEVLDRHVWCEMLVTSLGPCSIGDKSGEGDGIGGQYLVVRRGRGDDFFGVFGREAISAHECFHASGDAGLSTDIGSVIAYESIQESWITPSAR